MDYIKACREDELNNTRIKSITLLGKKIGIIRDKDSNLYAIEVGCKHQGADITKGNISGDIATCPRHGWKYDLQTGKCLNHDASPLRKHGLKIENGMILITAQPLPDEEEEDDLLNFFK